MFGLSLSHLIILLFIFLLFGYKRLPGLGHALGKGIASFKKGLEGADDPDKLADRSRDRHGEKDPHDHV